MNIGILGDTNILGINFKRMFMDVIYYYSFLFYTKIIKDNEPHATTIWVLSFAEGFFTSVVIDIFSIRFFCISLSKWIMMSIGIIFVFVNYLYFYRSERFKKIVETKPMFYSNNRVSVLLTSVFFIVLLSSMFWGPILSKNILDIFCK